MTDLWDNPMETDGFEFVEYTAPDVKDLHVLFERMGYRAVGRHRAVMPVRLPGKTARAVKDGANLPAADATLGRRTWEEFLTDLTA